MVAGLRQKKISAAMKEIFFFFMLSKSFTVYTSGTIECICENTVCPVTKGKCTTRFGCFSLLEQDSKGPGKEKVTKGCLKNEAHKEIICETGTDRTVICCNTNFCNMNVTAANMLEPTEKNYGSPTSIADSFLLKKVFVTAGVLSLVIVFIIIFAFLWHRRRTSHNSEPSLVPLDAEKGRDDLLDRSAGSGAGLPLLVQRTIAKQLTLVRSVGKGRYGEVWQAKWRGRDVAVKIFLSHCEASWKRETEIYETVPLRHENILGFIASDIIGRNQQTHMYLITDYHPHGSLYDFLQSHALNKRTTIQLALSASTGLAHLHTEIQGTKGKPPIAHRDIKSKNILVKENLTCCLADFGLAVKYSSETEEVDTKRDTRVGTKRYMAPEVLGNMLNYKNFAAFKMTDVYSFGLVLWEIARRCSSDETGLCEEYQVPYFDMLPCDPSFDEVKKVVLTEKRRPSIPPRWHQDEPLSTMTKLMTGCWANHPVARLAALRIQKALSKLKKSMDLTDQPCDLTKNNRSCSVAGGLTA